MGATYTTALVATWTTDSRWNGTGPGWIQLLQTASVAAFALIPVAMGVAILRYHLYDLGFVIRKTLLIATLAIFITGVYVAVVTGVGAIVGAAGSPVLSAIAAAIVALAFQPARRAAGRFADRVVYGDRATPYELLSEFSDRVGATYAAEDVLPRMARLVADGIGADRTEVWVRTDDALRVAASWPPGGHDRATDRVPVPDDPLVDHAPRSRCRLSDRGPWRAARRARRLDAGERPDGSVEGCAGPRSRGTGRA